MNGPCVLEKIANYFFVLGWPGRGELPGNVQRRLVEEQGVRQRDEGREEEEYGRGAEKDRARSVFQ